jgi:hypothetical protein
MVRLFSLEHRYIGAILIPFRMSFFIPPFLVLMIFTQANDLLPAATCLSSAQTSVNRRRIKREKGFEFNDDR